MTDGSTTKSQGQSSAFRYNRWHLDFVDDATNVSSGRTGQRLTPARDMIEEFFHPPGFPSTLSARDLSPFETSNLSSSVSGRRSSRSSGNCGGGETTKTKHNKIVEDDRDTAMAAYRHSWTVAFSPLRAMLTSALALYLAGSRVQFFTIASTVTVLFTHISSLFATMDAFRAVRRSYPLTWQSLTPQLIVHVCLCAAGIAMGLYKADKLGFLPVTESDWIGLLPSYTVAPMTFRHAPPLH